jgi:hypothetical protein
MAGLLGSAGRSPAAATTEDEEDVDGAPLGGAVGSPLSGYHRS